jgi:hypothetical protein
LCWNNRNQNPKTSHRSRKNPVDPRESPNQSRLWARPRISGRWKLIIKPEGIDGPGSIESRPVPLHRGRSGLREARPGAGSATAVESVDGNHGKERENRWPRAPHSQVGWLWSLWRFKFSRGNGSDTRRLWFSECIACWINKTRWALMWSECRPDAVYRPIKRSGIRHQNDAAGPTERKIRSGGVDVWALAAGVDRWRHLICTRRKTVRLLNNWKIARSIRLIPYLRGLKKSIESPDSRTSPMRLKPFKCQLTSYLSHSNVDQFRHKTSQPPYLGLLLWKLQFNVRSIYSVWQQV